MNHGEILYVLVCSKREGIFNDHRNKMFFDFTFDFWNKNIIAFDA